MADNVDSPAFCKWLKSAEGKACLNIERVTHKSLEEKYLRPRLRRAFSAGWNARPAIEYAPYESLTIAISTDVGYQAFHESIQEGWEPLLFWTDKSGDHVAMRRLRV